MESTIIWKDVEGYEGLYKISNTGLLLGLKRNKILKGKIDKDGYIEYVLSNGVSKSYKRGHRLVAEAFIPNPDNLPVINHIDHSKDNNHYENLEWTTVCKNTKHYYAGPNYKDGIERPLSSLSKEDLFEVIRMYTEDFCTYQNIVDHFNLSCRPDAIGEILNGSKFSEITGIDRDLRVPDRHPSTALSDDDVLVILEDYFINKIPRTVIKKKYNVTDKWMSVVFSGKSRKRATKHFADSVGKSMQELLNREVWC